MKNRQSEANTPLGLGSFHRWKASGGALNLSKKQRLQFPKLYPYLLGRNGQEIRGGGVSVVAILNVLVALGVIVAYFYYAGTFATRVSGRTLDVPDDAEMAERGLAVVFSTSTPGVSPATPLPDGVIVSEGVFVRPVGVVSTSTPGGSSPSPPLSPTLTPTVTPPPGDSLKLSFYDYPEYEPIFSDVVGQYVELQIFSYWPPLSDDFCDVYDYAAGDCSSFMTSGDDWRSWDGQALACPADWLGAYVDVPSIGRLPCLDTGSTIACEGVLCRVALLDSSMAYVEPAWMPAFLYR